MQKLPIGEQYFPRLREDGKLYVDKTEQIYELMNTGRFVFLSRPRRFGKSLLTTTLQAVYQGRQDLFQGLWIEDKIDWHPRPVLLINFNDVNYQEQSLAQGLTDYLTELATAYGLTLVGNHYKEKFRELIRRLSEQDKVVLLIDEYDKPITDLLENEQRVKENVTTLKNFYSVLKATEANHLYFTFLTGVSKYGKVSIFSDLNNLLDITTASQFNTLLGYTQQELELYFAEYIAQMGNRYQVTKEEVLEMITYWYNGYSWDGTNTVYVPFSTLILFYKQTFENHWFSTGTPTFLIKLLRQSQTPAYALEDITADDTLLDRADVNDINIISLLFQTGYLTVKDIRTSLGKLRYKLGYPNHEVAQAFRKHLLADYLEIPAGGIGNQFLYHFEDALNALNIDYFITLLKSMFGRIPHTLFLPQEAYYHSIIYLLLDLLGCEIHVERLTNLGRVDAILEMEEAVLIMEFKMTTTSDDDPAETAIQQIREKQYDLPYQASGKQIIWLGVVFDYESRNISDWKVG